MGSWERYPSAALERPSQNSRTNERIISKQLLLLIFSLFLAQESYAVYRCGNTYSQTPCGPEAKKLNVQSTPANEGRAVPETSSERVEENIKLCEQMLREVPSWKDRESLRVTPVNRLPRTMVVDINGRKREVISYTSIVNGKNSYGAYQGERLAMCYFDLEDRNFLGYYIAR